MSRTEFLPSEDHTIVHHKVVHKRDRFQVRREIDGKATIAAQVRLNPNGTVFLSTDAYGTIGGSTVMEFEEFYELVRETINDRELK